MKNSKLIRTVTFLLILIILGQKAAVRPTDAQEVDCPVLVQQAYQATQDACDGIGRDEACYGNVRVTATAHLDAEAFFFESSGDRVRLADLQTLQLSSMNQENEEWGISLLRLRATLPEDNASQNVEVLLFGNVEIENPQVSGTSTPAAAPATVEITPAQSNNINVRSEPSTSAAILGTLAPNQTAVADGRNAVGDWLRITLPDGTGTGWVFASLVTVQGDVTALAVVDAAVVPEVPTEEPAPTSLYGPMQAFYFRSGVADRPCSEAPDSGILIQTPEGAGEITLLVNEVTIDLGSTAYLQGQPGDDMIVSVIEGQGSVTALNQTVSIPAGTRARIPLDANTGLAAGAPIGPEPYDDVALQVLPTLLLSNQVAVAPALTEEQIIELANFVPLPTSGLWARTYQPAVFEGNCESLPIGGGGGGDFEEPPIPVCALEGPNGQKVVVVDENAIYRANTSGFYAGDLNITFIEAWMEDFVQVGSLTRTTTSELHFVDDTHLTQVFRSVNQPIGCTILNSASYELVEPDEAVCTGIRYSPPPRLETPPTSPPDDFPIGTFILGPSSIYSDSCDDTNTHSITTATISFDENYNLLLELDEGTFTLYRDTRTFNSFSFQDMREGFLRITVSYSSFDERLSLDILDLGCGVSTDLIRPDEPAPTPSE